MKGFFLTLGSLFFLLILTPVTSAEELHGVWVKGLVKQTGITPEARQDDPAGRFETGVDYDAYVRIPELLTGVIRDSRFKTEISIEKSCLSHLN